MWALKQQGTHKLLAVLIISHKLVFGVATDSFIGKITLPIPHIGRARNRIYTNASQCKVYNSQLELALILPHLCYYYTIFQLYIHIRCVYEDVQSQGKGDCVGSGQPQITACTAEISV